MYDFKNGVITKGRNKTSAIKQVITQSNGMKERKGIFGLNDGKDFFTTRANRLWHNLP